MMLKTLEFRELGKTDLIPQAIIRKPITYFERQAGTLVRDCDALDFFEGAAFALEDGLPFALIHHRGNPADETTLYLTRDCGRDTGGITNSIRRILRALQLTDDSLVWERQNGPEL
ncbi:MAG: hypothetical protein ABSG46_02590 [Candidatus Binataceae bacterium]|jgi:hypothetical protein